MKRNAIWNIGMTVAAAAVSACGSEGPSDRPVTAVTTEDLYVAYRDNPAAAGLQFDNNRVRVTGPIDSIEAGANNEVEVFLTTPHGGIAPIDFINDERAAIAKLKQGQTITVTCEHVRKMQSTEFIFPLTGCVVG